MNHRTMVCVAILICGMVGAQMAAQQTAPPPLPNIQKLGPQVGTRVPDFTFVDQKGQSRTLASLMGPKGLMLVFYRSSLAPATDAVQFRTPQRARARASREPFAVRTPAATATVGAAARSASASPARLGLRPPLRAREKTNFY